eukprot:m.48855 g.48855  ORF g.48855 m.48855 type:complete len:885 (+) comp7419_c0_seq1:255-2909(+)
MNGHCGYMWLIMAATLVACFTIFPLVVIGQYSVEVRQLRNVSFNFQTLVPIAMAAFPTTQQDPRRYVIVTREGPITNNGDRVRVFTTPSQSSLNPTESEPVNDDGNMMDILHPQGICYDPSSGNMAILGMHVDGDSILQPSIIEYPPSATDEPKFHHFDNVFTPKEGLAEIHFSDDAATPEGGWKVVCRAPHVQDRADLVLVGTTRQSSTQTMGTIFWMDAISDQTFSFRRHLGKSGRLTFIHNALLVGDTDFIIVVGYSTGSILPTQPHIGKKDAFVAKLAKSSTTVVWVMPLATKGDDEATAITMDVDGGFFVAGYASGDLSALVGTSSNSFSNSISPTEETHKHMFAAKIMESEVDGSTVATIKAVYEHDPNQQDSVANSIVISTAPSAVWLGGYTTSVEPNTQSMYTNSIVITLLESLQQVHVVSHDETVQNELVLELLHIPGEMGTHITALEEIEFTSTIDFLLTRYALNASASDPYFQVDESGGAQSSSSTAPWYLNMYAYIAYGVAGLLLMILVFVCCCCTCCACCGYCSCCHVRPIHCCCGMCSCCICCAAYFDDDDDEKSRKPKKSGSTKKRKEDTNNESLVEIQLPNLHIRSNSATLDTHNRNALDLGSGLGMVKTASKPYGQQSNTSSRDSTLVSNPIFEEKNAAYMPMEFDPSHTPTILKKKSSVKRRVSAKSNSSSTNAPENERLSQRRLLMGRQATLRRDEVGKNVERIEQDEEPKVTGNVYHHLQPQQQQQLPLSRVSTRRIHGNNISKNDNNNATAAYQTLNSETASTRNRIQSVSNNYNHLETFEEDSTAVYHHRQNEKEADDNATHEYNSIDYEEDVATHEYASLDRERDDEEVDEKLPEVYHHLHGDISTKSHGEYIDVRDSVVA